VIKKPALPMTFRQDRAIGRHFGSYAPDLFRHRARRRPTAVEAGIRCLGPRTLKATFPQDTLSRQQAEPEIANDRQ
jgi:hypothetical protein